jgi:hypothetical protein
VEVVFLAAMVLVTLAVVAVAAREAVRLYRGPS